MSDSLLIVLHAVQLNLNASSAHHFGSGVARLRVEEAAAGLVGVGRAHRGIGGAIVAETVVTLVRTFTLLFLNGARRGGVAVISDFPDHNLLDLLLPRSGLLVFSVLDGVVDSKTSTNCTKDVL